MQLFAFNTISAQVPFDINIHLYKPLEYNREIFENNILSFYTSYQAGIEFYFPQVYIIRQDYSELKNKQTFSVLYDGLLIEFSEEYIREHKLATLIANLNSKKNRMYTLAEPMIHTNRALRKYDCNFEKDTANATLHLFLGSKSDPKTNHFNNVKKVKKKILQMLRDNPKAIINVHLGDQDEICTSDNFYHNRSTKFLQYDPFGMIESNLTETEAKDIISKNREIILYDIQSKLGVDVSIDEDKMTFLKSSANENGIIFDVKWATRHKNSDDLSNSAIINDKRLGSVEISINLDKNGNYSSHKINNINSPFVESAVADQEISGMNEITDLANENNTTSQEGDENAIATSVTSEPVYPGGVSALMTEIFNYIMYPKEYIASNIEGTVYVNFLVEKSGEISEINVERGVKGAPEFSRQVVNALSRINKKFKPAVLEGKIVRYRYRVPIKFSIK